MLPPYTVTYYNAEPGDKLDAVIDVPHGGKEAPFFDYYKDCADVLGGRRAYVERLCRLEADTSAPEIGYSMGDLFEDSGCSVALIDVNVPREWADMDRNPTLAPAFLYNFERHPTIFARTMRWYDGVQTRRRALWGDLKPTGRLIANHTMRSRGEPGCRVKKRNEKLCSLFGPNFDFTTFNWNQFEWNQVDWQAVNWEENGVGGWIQDRVDSLMDPAPDAAQRKCAVVNRRKTCASETGTLNAEQSLLKALTEELDNADIEYDIDGAYFYSPRMLSELVTALGKFGVLFETRKELMAMDPTAPLDELVINHDAVQRRAKILAQAVLAVNTRERVSAFSNPILAMAN